jgi:hypothetical protein
MTIAQVTPKREGPVIVSKFSHSLHPTTMTTTVPLSAFATCLEDIDAPLTRKFLFPQDDVEIVSLLSICLLLPINLCSTVK